MVSTEHCLLFILGFDIHIVEAPTDVELDEVLGSTKLRDEFGDQKKGVFVFDCHGVEGSIVPDQVEGTIFFLDEEYQGSHGEFKGLDLSSIQVLFEENVHLLLFYRGQRVHLG